MDDAGRPAGALERAVELYDLVDAEAAAAERQGRLTEPVTAALLAARLFQILLPEKLGGLGGGPRDLFEAVEAIARADGSAGWCVAVCNTITVTAALGLPDAGRQEVFGAGPAACWASLLPNAAATAEAGGYRVSCRGVFGSGSAFSGWVLIAANLGAPGEGRYRAFLAPRAEVETDDASWDVMGLRATTSVDYRIADRFVPARRSWEYVWTGGDGTGAMTGMESVRWGAIGLTAFASGVGLRAQDELLGSAARTRRTAGVGAQSDDGALQFGLGELDGRLRAARAHVVGLIDAIGETTERRAASPEQAIALVQACQTLARASREMAVFAFDNAGASVVHARSPLQRCLRDIFTGLKHASFTPALLGRVGKVRLGQPFGGAPL